MTTITLLPPAPSRADPANFANVADTFVAALPTFGTEVNTVAGEINTNTTTASTAATTATTQAGIATTKAGEASTSASTASTGASTATTQAGIATTQAGIATTKAGEALSSANAAAASAATINLTAPGPIGGTTPNTGKFTTLTTTGNATIGDAEAADTHAIKGATTLLANSASAALTVTQTGAGNAFVVEDSVSTDSTPFVVDAVGRVIVGHTAAVPGIFNQAFLEIHNVAGNTAQSIQRYSADAFSPDIDFVKSRNATTGSHTIVQSGDDLGTLRFAGSDGTGFIQAAEIKAEVDGTPGTNDMPGRLVFSTTADGASSPTERMRIDSAGSVGIGIAPSAGYTLEIGKNITGSTECYAVMSEGTIQSDVTAQATYFRSYANTANAAFTLPAIFHYSATQGTLTGGSRTAPTDQKGFSAESTLTGATNNYGFYSNIPAAANRYNFYAAGTADNYFAGSVGIGATLSQVSLYNTRNLSGNASSYGFYEQATVQSDVTSAAFGFRSNLSTAAAAFTLASHYSFYAGQGTVGATSAITNNYGFVADSSLTGATNNYGFYSAIPAAANRYNFYAAGTANNAYAGNSSFGKVTAPTSAVDTTSFGTNLVTISAGTYTVLTTDHTIIQTTAGSTYTLPAAASFPGRKLHLLTQFAGAVISASSNVVPIAGGAAGTAILPATAGKFAILQSNGTNWLIIASN